jgi:hypothetical protein
LEPSPEGKALLERLIFLCYEQGDYTAWEVSGAGGIRVGEVDEIRQRLTPPPPRPRLRVVR